MSSVNSKQLIMQSFDIAKHSPSSDIAAGMLAWRIWGTLGWHDIKQRYRRSVLGPFWFTINTAILVIVLGLLYSTLLKQDVKTYLPFLAVGLVIWLYIGGVINEGCSALTGSAHLIKQIRLPLTIHVCRMVWRNFVILLHSLPIVIIWLIAFGDTVDAAFMLVPLGLFVLLLQGVWMGVVLGILCARFRDIPPIVTNLVQVAFFFTPVMWMPEILEDRAWIAEYNPLFHIIEIVRAPLLDRPIHLDSWLWSLGLLIVGFALAQYLMCRARNRVAYWL
jgi:lipopolysaccharide transport system permease protein